MDCDIMTILAHEILKKAKIKGHTMLIQYDADMIAYHANGKLAKALVDGKDSKVSKDLIIERTNFENY
jgi:hypothetical protein